MSTPGVFGPCGDAHPLTIPHRHSVLPPPREHRASTVRGLFGLVLSTLVVGDEARLAMRFQVAQGAGHVQAGAIAILRNVGEKAEVNK